MAIQGQFTDKDFIVYDNAYARIVKLRTSILDYEKIEFVGDHEVVKWITRVETIATYYVYPDQGARKNMASLISHGSFEFNYDLDSKENIYTQAYNKLASYLKLENPMNV